FYDSLRRDNRFGTLLRRFDLAGAASESVDAASVRTRAPDPISTSPDDIQQNETRNHQAQTSSDRLAKNRYLILGGLALVLLVIIGLLYWSYANRRPQISSVAVM